MYRYSYILDVKKIKTKMNDTYIIIYINIYIYTYIYNYMQTQDCI